jgi:hypothetical protein
MSKSSLLMKKVSIALTSGLAASSLAGCGSTQSANIPDMPQNEDCRDWEFDDDEGVWVCDDDNSHYYRSYYHGGSFYPTKKSLHGSKSYKNYKSSNNFAGSSSSKKSGFGKGSSGGFGG